MLFIFFIWPFSGILRSPNGKQTPSSFTFTGIPTRQKQIPGIFYFTEISYPRRGNISLAIPLYGDFYNSIVKLPWVTRQWRQNIQCGWWIWKSILFLDFISSMPASSKATDMSVHCALFEVALVLFLFIGKFTFICRIFALNRATIIVLFNTMRIFENW